MVYMKRIDAIVLAGGLGTRLREVVKDRPKVLAPVNGRALLELVLDFLNEWPCIRRVVVAVGYMSDRIRAEFTDPLKYNFEIVYSEEKDLLGTGGATKQALKYTETEDVLVMNGDTYVEINIDDLARFHNDKKAAATLVLRSVEDPSRYGSVELEGDRVTLFEEKRIDGTGQWINAGMYIFRRDLFDYAREGKVLSLERELLPGFLVYGVYGFKCFGKFIDIGTPESYGTADIVLQRNNEG
jgi:D-glycero-alpha-D-manno-heptose 1-phosphate guanylyltransferase